MNVVLAKVILNVFNGIKGFFFKKNDVPKIKIEEAPGSFVGFKG